MGIQQGGINSFVRIQQTYNGIMKNDFYGTNQVFLRFQRAKAAILAGRGPE